MKTQMANQNGKSVVVRIISTEPQSEPSESSPLNQRGRDNNSDASSSASAVTSEQSTKKLIEADMDQSKKILLKIGVDIVLLCCGELHANSLNDNERLSMVSTDISMMCETKALHSPEAVMDNDLFMD
jgi:hypothetical protein